MYYHWVSTSLLLASTAKAVPALFDRADCTIPSSFSAVSVAKLPDPFTFSNGNKVATLADWSCRQQEISAIMQQFELGTKPGKPSTFSATYSGGTLSITAGEGGKSISFTAKVSAPSGGSAPYPAIITIGGSSIPIPNTVGTIAFNNDEMGQQASGSSRGKGKFFDLYGSGHTAGATTAWAWGVSRIIDGLEATTGHNIDVKRLGVTGCSRNGKGAFVVGALDNRIALTIPQESGSGGAACWRVSDQQKSAGKNIQTAGEIVGENVWFSKTFDQYSTKTNTLPHDHHMLAGLVAPRGLYVIENDIDWLGPVSTTACMKAGRLIYKAAGAPTNMGFSLVGGHSHCQFPSAQSSELTAYINKFLLAGTTDPGAVERSSATVNMDDWVPWTVPALS